MLTAKNVEQIEHIAIDVETNGPCAGIHSMIEYETSIVGSIPTSPNQKMSNHHNIVAE